MNRRLWLILVGIGTLGAVLGLAIPSGATVSASSPPAPGSISGTVYDNAATPSPLAGVCVSANDGAGHSFSAGPTGANGSYVIANVVGGPFHLRFFSWECSAGPYAVQWYNGLAAGAAAEGGATPVQVGATGVNAHLARGGSISGTVTDTATTPAPLAGICVSVQDGTSNPHGAPGTSSSGTYTVSGLAAGRYQVQFYDCSGGNRVPQWYSNAVNPTTANSVSVGAGANVTGINAKMAPGGSISGTVTDNATTPAPLAGICVSAQDGAGHFASAPPTTSTGTYTLPRLAAARYQVQFYDCTGGNRVPQWYSNATNPTGSTPVSVAAGANVNGINAKMTPGGSISGTVTDNAATPAPLAGICVLAQDGAGHSGGAGATTSAGTYTIPRLTAGRYQVQFTDCTNGNHLPQWYSKAGNSLVATPVTVGVGADVTGINAAMVLAGSISGTVTDNAATPTPLAGICVSAQDGAGHFAGAPPTTSTGSYTLPRLAAGRYQVLFSDCFGGNHIRQWYSNVTVSTGATPVSVAIGANVTGINAKMAAGGSISGTVTDNSASPAPLAGICVYAQDFAGHFGSARTAPDGTYSITVLATSFYEVQFSDCIGGGRPTRWYDGTATGSLVPGGAAPVHVVAPAVKAGINARM
jgi:hypothetical protein